MMLAAATFSRSNTTTQAGARSLSRIFLALVFATWNRHVNQMLLLENQFPNCTIDKGTIF